MTAGTTLDEAPASSGSPLQIGQVVAGKYRIERQIGRGGMGIVLAATHLQLEHLVAIKVMRRDLLEDDQALTRLLIEARAAARIRSEHVARVLDVGTLESGSPFIVMEYLEGEDLADLLDRQGALDVHQALMFMLQSCEALAEVHVSEMVHRDLKPGNLFIARLPDGSPTLKIVDFGISKHIGRLSGDGGATTSPQVLGSPFYMSPEQMRAEPVDERSDIWGLGAILFEMLTGRPPFVGETLPEVYAAVLNDAPPAIDSLRPGAPAGLDDVVQRCLAKDPAQRFCDVADLAEALQPFAGPTSAPSVERITRILTNPEPIRARYSSIPAAPLNVVDPPREAAASAGSGEGTSGVRSGVERDQGVDRRPSQPLEAWPSRGSRTGAELHPLSATGAEPRVRRKARAAWLLIAAAVAAGAAAVWLRNLDRAVSGTQHTRAAASAELSPAQLAGVAAPEIAPALQAVAPPALAAEHGELEGALRMEKRALRAQPRRASPSVEDFRAAIASEKKPAGPGAAELAAVRRPAKLALPEPRQERAASAEAEVPPRDEASLDDGAPDVSLRETRSSVDPWDPSSFGDRR